MTLDETLEFAIQGMSILFLGSGFSREAEDVRGNKLKSGPELAKHLSDLCGADETLPLDQAAELCIDSFGEDTLIDTIKKLYTVTQIAQSQAVIASVIGSESTLLASVHPETPDFEGQHRPFSA